MEIILIQQYSLPWDIPCVKPQWNAPDEYGHPCTPTVYKMYLFVQNCIDLVTD